MIALCDSFPILFIEFVDSKPVCYNKPVSEPSWCLQGIRHIACKGSDLCVRKMFDILLEGNLIRVSRCLGQNISREV